MQPNPRAETSKLLFPSSRFCIVSPSVRSCYFEAKGENLLTTLFNVSGTRLKQRAPGEAVRYESQDIPGLLLEVVPAQTLGWKKCERCWTWSPRVGEDPAHPTLCERCTPVVTALQR